MDESPLFYSTTDTTEDVLNSLEYNNEEYGFGLNPPEGWTKQDISNDYGLFLYFYGPTEGNFQINMYISNSTLKFDETLSNIAETIIEPFSSNDNITLILNSETTVNDMNAYELIYTTDLIKQKMVMVEKNNMVLILVFSALVNSYDTYISVFEESVNSLVID